MEFKKEIDTGLIAGDGNGAGLRTNMRILIANDVHLKKNVDSLWKTTSLVARDTQELFEADKKIGERITKEAKTFNDHVLSLKGQLPTFVSSYNVSNLINPELERAKGVPLDRLTSYRVKMTVKNTGSGIGSCFLLTYERSSWIIKTVYKTINGSNVPYLIQDAGKVRISHDHRNTYTIIASIEVMPANKFFKNDIGIWGADAMFKKIKGNIGVNFPEGTTPSEKFDVNGKIKSSGLQVNEYTVTSKGNQSIHGEASIFANSGDESLFLGLKNSVYPNRGWAFNPVAYGSNSNLQIKEHGATSVRMTLQSGGNVGIGTDKPSEKLDVRGFIKSYSLVQLSDRKFKTNIELIDGEWALSVYKKLKYSFYDFSITNTKQAGLIAQEVEKILPQAVSTTESGEKSLDYNYIDIISKSAIQHFIKTQIK